MHQYGNGKVDIQAVHQCTTHLPTLQMPHADRNHTHLQHLPPQPEPHQSPDWVPEDAPYTSHDRAHHYPNPISHLAWVLNDAHSRAHIQELQETLKVPLYHSALRPACVLAHMQKRHIQLLRQQLPFLTRVARWLARKHIHLPEEHTRCPCDHTTPDDWEHFKTSPLHAGRDTLVVWSPADTLQQHEGWPSHSVIEIDFCPLILKSESLKMHWSTTASPNQSDTYPQCLRSLYSIKIPCIKQCDAQILCISLCLSVLYN